MGHTYSSREDLTARSAYRKASGTTFAHTSTMRSTPRSEQKIHESVDPKKANTLGEKIRECLDSDAHPETTGAVIGFDQTGSMGHVPRQLQEKLAMLKALTLRVGLPHLQLCFAAYGDAQNGETGRGEVAPCQVGQFESGLEMETQLNDLFLEGAGGGNNGETSGLLLHFLGNFSRLDSLSKRGKKGYLILTGDELPLPFVTKAEIKTYLDETVQGDLPIADVVRRAQESYEVFFFLVDNGAARAQGSRKVWEELLGADHVIIAQDTAMIAEQIALLLALEEGVIDTLEEGENLLTQEGADRKSVESAATALVVRAASGNGRSVSKATVTGTLPAPAPAAEAIRL